MIRHYTKGYQFVNYQNILKSRNDNEKDITILKKFLLDFKHIGLIDETIYIIVTPENFRTPLAYFLEKTQN